MSGSRNARYDEILLERSRLQSPPPRGSKPSGIGTVRFYADCEHNCEQVLSRAKEIMIIMNQSAEEWPSDDKWRGLLPQWFIERSAPENTDDDDWSILEFAYWFRLENREWFWWDAAVFYYEDGRPYIGVAVVVLGWPFPWGALNWLFKAAGASNFEPEESA